MPDPNMALARCVHCAGDTVQIPGVGHVHADGQRAARTATGSTDHLAMPVGLVPGLPQRLGLVRT